MPHFKFVSSHKTSKIVYILHSENLFIFTPKRPTHIRTMFCIYMALPTVTSTCRNILVYQVFLPNRGGRKRVTILSDKMNNKLDISAEPFVIILTYAYARVSKHKVNWNKFDEHIGCTCVVDPFINNVKGLACSSFLTRWFTIIFCILGCHKVRGL